MLTLVQEKKLLETLQKWGSEEKKKKVQQIIHTVETVYTGKISSCHIRGEKVVVTRRTGSSKIVNVASNELTSTWSSLALLCRSKE